MIYAIVADDFHKVPINKEAFQRITYQLVLKINIPVRP